MGEAPGRTKVLPPVYLFGALMAMVCLRLYLPGPWRYGGPLRYLGLILGAAGLATIIGIASLFRRAETTIKPFETSSRLLTGGPYRLSRNPIYLAMVVMLLGPAVFLGSATPFLVIPLFIGATTWRFIRAEEVMLEQSFGQEYAEYKKGVRRWL